jgi:hypothetical protein
MRFRIPLFFQFGDILLNLAGRLNQQVHALSIGQSVLLPPWFGSVNGGICKEHYYSTSIEKFFISIEPSSHGF